MNAWPALPYEAWKDTYATLHMWLQIAGKIRLAQSPWVNHQWHVTLYVTARGLTTSAIPHGTRVFQIDFDFIDHRVELATSDGTARSLPLEPQAVADFYRKLMAAMDELGVPVRISKKPNEVPHPIAFDRDEVHRAYDPEYAQRFWRALVQADRVFKMFRARFRGKSSPVHFFWGAADLAVTRFSGRAAPEHPGGIPSLPDRLVREAYSHECASCGFWAGGERYPQPMFFSYAYPEPPRFKEALPGYEAALGEYVLPYDAVRSASSPDDMLLEFLQSTYEAAANLGGWDRSALEMPAH
jgi:uncharacterized protein DUF5996